MLGLGDVTRLAAEPEVFADKAKQGARKRQSR